MIAIIGGLLISLSILVIIGSLLSRRGREIDDDFTDFPGGFS